MNSSDSSRPASQRDSGSRCIASSRVSSVSAFHSHPDNIKEHQHYIHILDGQEQLVSCFLVDVNEMQYHSIVLNTQIIEDQRLGRRISNVEALKPITTWALSTMVRAISEYTIMAGTGGHTELISIPSDKLLELSIVLWQFKCSTILFNETASIFRAYHWLSENGLPNQKLEEWMNIALVFGWQDIFESTSRAVIKDYDGLDNELEGTDYLPRQLQDLITEKRRDLKKEVFELMREGWIQLGCVGSGWSEPFTARLNDVGINLHMKTLPDQMSPEKLLRAFEAALGAPPEPLPPQGPVAATQQSQQPASIHHSAPHPGHKWSGGTRAGPMSGLSFKQISELIERTSELIKGIFRSRPSPGRDPSPQESLDDEFLKLWDTEVKPKLQDLIGTIRQEYFIGISSESDIWTLRGRQMLRTL